eukprot:SAG31_NODE_1691_length_7513_cov_11.746830_3_plen_149_part_00
MQIHSHKNQHPGQPRSFSAREYARMQGLPDRHFLCGDAPKQFEQVGNAVCARLAINLGKALCLAVMDGAPKDPIVEVEPEPPAGDPDAVAAGMTDAVDGDEGAVGDAVDEVDDRDSPREVASGRRRKAKDSTTSKENKMKGGKKRRVR